MSAGPTPLFTWAYIVAGAVIVVVLLLDQEFSNSTGHAFTAYKPRLFPLLCAVGLILTGGFELLPGNRVSPVKDNKPSVYSYRASLGTFAIMLFFAASFGVLGFVASSFVAMTLLSLFSGSRNLLQIFLIAGLLPSFLYVLMVYIMGISLPAGVIF